MLALQCVVFHFRPCVRASLFPITGESTYCNPPVGSPPASCLRFVYDVCVCKPAAPVYCAACDQFMTNGTCKEAAYAFAGTLCAGTGASPYLGDSSVGLFLVS